MSFAGLRVLSFESRRSAEIAELIRKQGGDPVLAPAVREAPLESNEHVFRFAERLFAGEFEMMIFLTGVGARALNEIVSSRFPQDAFATALRRITVVARGPKPAAALRELEVPVTINVPEPNTSHEIIAAIANRPERRIAIQEYGRSNVELTEALLARGAEVTRVRVYQYEMPLDLAPLENAVRQIAGRRVSVVLFTTAIQMAHLVETARKLLCEREMIAGLRSAMIASIGPTTNEGLEEFGIHPDMVPSHPKMGFLVKEAAEQAAGILARKKG
jgi:uroporphyrinogen-III synthase